MTVLAGLLGFLQPAWAADGRVVNLSTRALVETGEEVMIGGFIIENGSRQVLIQAIGPELANFGISNALADPVLTVIQTSEGEPPRVDLDPPLELMVNDNWEDSQGQLVSDIWGGSPNLAGGSLSSAAVLTLDPGGYTARVQGKNGTTGVAIVEVYDIESAGGDGQVVNLSTRALVKTGEEVMIGGFIIEEGTRRVLIQAVGPELVNSGISNVLADPVLTLIKTSEGEPPRVVLDPPLELMVNDNWEDSQGKLVSDIWGVSPNLAGGSLSSAAVLTLNPGGYTARVEGKNGTTGVAIVEVYGIGSDLDRVALAALFNAMNGANWTNRTNWLSDLPLDQWHGIEVDESGRVIHLDLSANQLSGNIPPELGDLASLETLSLHTNELTGTIPAELGNLANLQILWLHRNQLSGAIPAELGNLANLQELSLRTNELTGTIPVELGNLSSLQALWLHQNQLSGNIPAELGNLANLQILRLQQNQLSGAIPAELGNLAGLQELSLHTNQLSGSIPATLGELANLEILWLQQNRLSGNIPTELDNLTGLEELSLHTNELSGPIPAELGNLTGLQALWLQRNELRGAIPAALGNLANLQSLSLHTNQLGGSIPLSFLALPISIFRYDNTDVCVPADAGLRAWLDSIQTLIGTGLDCQGSESSDRDILETLFNATDGSNWTNRTNWLTDAALGEWHGVTVDGNGRVIELALSSNQLSGPIPVEVGDLANLQILWLQRNELNGNIPAELGNLTGLQELSLHTNELTGPIPAALGNLTGLQALWLQRNELRGAIPAELGNLTNLQSLSLHTNQLGGSIPLSFTALPISMFRYDNTDVCVPADAGLRAWLDSIQTHIGTGVDCQGSESSDRGILEALYNATDGPNWTSSANWLTEAALGQWHGVTVDGNGRVIELDLSANLLSGPIPAELGNLAILQILWLQENQLSGNIPTKLGNLTGLQELSLRTNLLTGTIPVELGKLSRLQGLWLQRNQLTGNIPTELGDLANLQTLSLHTNELGGNIPDELGSLANLQILRLHQNLLSEAIPSDLGNLAGLQELSLHTNQLSGNIPVTLGNLADLEILWLHLNQLSGAIPVELGNLAGLQELSLRTNLLTGTIPLELGNLSVLRYF